MTSKRPFISVKTSPPYTPAQESSVYLNPQSRAVFVPEQNTWRFVDSNTTPSHPKKSSLAAKEALIFSSSSSFTGPSSSSSPRLQIERSVVEMAQELQVTNERGVGVDVEPLSDFYPRLFNSSEAVSQTLEWAQSAIADSTFVQRNYTEVEIQYCLSSSTTVEDVCAKFTGRWCAKEAVIKALTSSDSSAQQTLWKSSSAGLKEIEIRPTSSGAPLVVLVGHAEEVAKKVGVKNVKLSISHSGDYAMALAATSS
jgi:fatty acid synthase subunit alpha